MAGRPGVDTITDTITDPRVDRQASDNAFAAPMKTFIALAFVGILVALGAALVFLMRDKGATNRTVNALTVRVGLSIALLVFIWFSYWMGWIEPRSY